MNVKEFLSQAYYIDRRIKENTERIEFLREFASSANSTLSPFPKIASRNFSHMEESIAKFMDIENEIKTEMEKLISVKLEIMLTICGVEDFKHRRLLELRYLRFKKWKEIVEDLGYDLHYIYKLHTKALKSCELVLKKKIPKDT